jgi:transcriptional regulator with XRE-family HTH domain
MPILENIYTFENGEIMKLYEKILMERRKQKKNQREIAEAVGISIGYYSKIERGKRDVPLSTLARICKKLGFSLFFYLEDNENIAFKVEL